LKKLFYLIHVCPCFTHEILHINDGNSNPNCAVPIKIASQNIRLLFEIIFMAATLGYAKTEILGSPAIMVSHKFHP
jgi:hypothetical protein